MRSVRNRSLLDVNEDFEHKRNVAFKRGQRVLAHFAERSNEKELNAEITPSGKFFLEALTNSKEILSLKSSTTNQTTVNVLLSEDLSSV